MAAELHPVDVDDRPGLRAEPLALEKRAVVVAGEEAGLLALAAPGDGKAGRGCLVAGAPLPLAAEREGDAVEQRRIDGRQHVGLILGGVAAAGDQPKAAPLDDPRVVARPENVAAGTLREVDEGVEPEAPVAAHAGIRGQALRVALDERLDDARPERVAQIEGDMGKPEPMAGLAGGDHRIGRAAGSLGARAGRVEPQAERDADRVRSGAQERDCAVDAAAHRNRDPAWTAGGREDRCNRVGERVGGESLAGDAGGLDQGQAVERPLEAGSVGLDDPIPVDEKPDRRIVGVPRGIPDQLDERHTSRLPARRRASACVERERSKREGTGGEPES